MWNVPLGYLEVRAYAYVSQAYMERVQKAAGHSSFITSGESVLYGPVHAKVPFDVSVIPTKFGIECDLA
jgi:hypothetical protein